MLTHRHIDTPPKFDTEPQFNGIPNMTFPNSAAIFGFHGVYMMPLIGYPRGWAKHWPPKWSHMSCLVRIPSGDLTWLALKSTVNGHPAIWENHWAGGFSSKPWWPKGAIVQVWSMWPFPDHFSSSHLVPLSTRAWKTCPLSQFPTWCLCHWAMHLGVRNSKGEVGVPHAPKAWLVDSRVKKGAPPLSWKLRTSTRALTRWTSQAPLRS